jgi:hypothetical protein
MLSEPNNFYDFDRDPRLQAAAARLYAAVALIRGRNLLDRAARQRYESWRRREWLTKGCCPADPMTN